MTNWGDQQPWWQVPIKKFEWWPDYPPNPTINVEPTKQKAKGMNYSKVVFLINSKVRAIRATYEAQDNAPRTLFKTLDPNTKIDDYVVVATDSRHKMTVVKVKEVDVEVDHDSEETVQWVIGKVDKDSYDVILKQEEQAIATIKSAETTRKRNELKKSLLMDAEEKIKALPIYSNGDSTT